MSRHLLAALIVGLIATTAAGQMTMRGGGPFAGGTVEGPAASVSFTRSEGLQTNSAELDDYIAISGGEPYATDLADLIGHADTAKDSWPHTLTAGAWEDDGDDCEPVGGTTTDDTLRLAATDVFALAMAGKLTGNALYYIEAREHILEFAATTGFDVGTLDGSNQCILHLGSAVANVLEAAWLLEDAGFGSWTPADRLVLATWAAEEAFPLLSWGIDTRKNNWGSVTFVSALATAAYANGGIAELTLHDATTETPSEYLGAAATTRLDKFLSISGGDELDSTCSPTYDFGLQANGAYPDDLRRPSTIGTADCEAATMSAHSSDGACSLDTTCGSSGGFFYSQKNLTALVHIAEILRRLGDGGAFFELDSRAGNQVNLIDMARFATNYQVSSDYQEGYIHDNTQFQYVLGSYFGDADLAAARTDGDVSVRGGRDLAYSKITHPPAAPAGDFVTLEESPLYNASGTLVDMTERVAPPMPLQLPIRTDSGFTINTDLAAASCSSDFTTSATIVSKIAAVSPYTVIVLPNCTINVEVLSDSATAPIRLGLASNGYDDGVILRGQANTKFYFRPQAAAVDWSGGNVARGPIIGRLLQIGEGTPSAFETCAWDPTSASIGSWVVKTSVSGCLDTYGAGDIIRLKTDSIPGAGTQGFKFATRITCRTTAAGVQAGSDCSRNPGINEIQLADPLPMDYRTGQYHWGENAGGEYTRAGNAGQGVYASTSGHLIEHIERVGSGRGGVGAETNNVPEFNGIENVTLESEYPGSGDGQKAYIRVENSSDSWFSGSEITRGYASHITVAGGMRFQIFGNKIAGPVYKSDCFGKIVSLTPDVNPVRLTVQTDTIGASSCSALESASPNPMIQISHDADEPGIAGGYFRFSIVTPASGTDPRTQVISLTGVDGAGMNPDPGGLIMKLDEFSAGGTYCYGPNSSNIQHTNNSMDGIRIGPLMQDGCSVVMNANFMTHNTATDRVFRGIFPHGNALAPGPWTEMNVMDGPQVFNASSNGNTGGTTRHGEGLNRLSYKDRLFNSGSGVQGDFGARGTFATNEQPHQGGASNEDWSILEGVVAGISGGDLDWVNNDGSSCNVLGGNCYLPADGDTAVSPYQTKGLAWFRTRCDGCNLDTGFDDGANVNPTTLTDTTSGGGDGSPERSESTTVPAAWAAEAGTEPTGIVNREAPPWWCVEAVAFGQQGGHYDDLTGGVLALDPIPAELLHADAACTTPGWTGAFDQPPWL